MPSSQVMIKYVLKQKERDLLEIVVTCLVLTNKREVARVRKRLKVRVERPFDSVHEQFARSVIFYLV